MHDSWCDFVFCVSIQNLMYSFKGIGLFRFYDRLRPIELSRQHIAGGIAIAIVPLTGMSSGHIGLLSSRYGNEFRVNLIEHCPERNG